MGSGYNHHVHKPNLQFYQKTTYLPMLCSRPSVKDVALPKWEDRPVSFSNDPLSPKIGCMGQVKRNNKIVGLPTSNKLTISTKSNGTMGYTKLKKIFSGKNLSISSTTSIRSSTCCRRGEVTVNGASGPKSDFGQENSVSVSIDDMDPPLPVIKKAQKPADGEVDSLWKRRSGGTALKNLQLQQIQLNRHHLAPTTV